MTLCSPGASLLGASSGSYWSSTTGKPSDDGVDDFPVTCPLVLPQRVFSTWKVIPPRPTLGSMVISCPWRGVVPPLCGLVPPRGWSCASATLDESLQVPGLDKFFYLILDGLTFLCGIFDVLVIVTPFSTADILLV